jgi:hypothetical protein
MQALEPFRVRAPLIEQGIFDLNGGLAFIHFYFHLRKTVPCVMSTPLTSTRVIIRGSSTVFPMLFCRMLVVKPSR